MNLASGNGLGYGSCSCGNGNIGVQNSYLGMQVGPMNGCGVGRDQACLDYYNYGYGKGLALGFDAGFADGRSACPPLTSCDCNGIGTCGSGAWWSSGSGTCGAGAYGSGTCGSGTGAYGSGTGAYGSGTCGTGWGAGAYGSGSCGSGSGTGVVWNGFVPNAYMSCAMNGYNDGWGLGYAAGFRSGLLNQQTGCC